MTELYNRLPRERDDPDAHAASLRLDLDRLDRLDGNRPRRRRLESCDFALKFGLERGEVRLRLLQALLPTVNDRACS